MRKKENILQEADRLVGGDRQKDYGHPYHDFAKTAKLWSVVLGDILKPGKEVTREQVALCMVMVKMSRQLNRPKRDNIVDGAGYLRTLEMIQDFEDELTDEEDNPELADACEVIASALTAKTLYDQSR